MDQSLDIPQESTHPSVRRVKALSELLDSAIRIPGTKRTVGLDPILGILPVAGDAAAMSISLYIVFEALRVGVPRAVLVKMMLYIGIDAVLGSVPVLGTVFDAVWKANERNARLLAKHVEGARRYTATDRPSR